MGRKSRKKKQKYIDKHTGKIHEMAECSPELMEQFRLNKDLTTAELDEINSCTNIYGYYLFNIIDEGAPGGGYFIISEETIEKLGPWTINDLNNNPDSCCRGIDQESVLYDEELLRACLTAEALEKDCVNLMFYVRLLMNCCLEEYDYDAGCPILVDRVEQDLIKRDMLREHTLNKYGIFLNSGWIGSTQTKTLSFEMGNHSFKTIPKYRQPIADSNHKPLKEA